MPHYHSLDYGMVNVQQTSIVVAAASGLHNEDTGIAKNVPP